MDTKQVSWQYLQISRVPTRLQGAPSNTGVCRTRARGEPVVRLDLRTCKIRRGCTWGIRLETAEAAAAPGLPLERVDVGETGVEADLVARRRLTAVRRQRVAGRLSQMRSMDVAPAQARQLTI